MTMKLWTPPGNFRAFKILIAAEYNSVEIDVPDFSSLDTKSPEFLAKSPMGRVPVLDTPQGSIFESNAIARYVARMRRDTEMCGASFFESSQVDSWIDFSSHEIELPAVVWVYPVIGYMPYKAEAVTKAKADLAEGLQKLESYLMDKTYLVGDKITLADITLVSTLVYPIKLVMDEKYRSQFPCVMRWFMTCVNQPQFVAVIGKVEPAKEELHAEGESKSKDTKKESKKVAKKETAKKDKPKKEAAIVASEEPADAPPAKKQVHPLAQLDKEKPSPFINDAWKKLYSNTKDYNQCMEEFWKMFDAEGWSLWICRYKYNEENKKAFMVSNLVGGFVQRSGEIRKWAFGVMQISGEEGKELLISGAWLFRGDTVQHLCDANDDANWYDWVKIETPVSDADKELIKEFWCSETTLEGRPIVDCKVFK
mmetsp:Transcript_930/g.1397  ORF Transcript_930/g.1397 Transcript_930/m.1397 type:complete len:424 (+) Transcript_930:83-1354(+)